MKKHHSVIASTPQRKQPPAHGARQSCPEDIKSFAPVAHDSKTPRASVARGLSAQVHSYTLQEFIWRRALTLTNRFRVIRTIDIAVCCFAERPFKAALSAAQRAVRGMVRAGLLGRYRTDRFMTVYGLTQRGAAWLDARDIPASASVRRVSDMSNPEHRLWSQFLVLSCEARGLSAQTELELMQVLNQGRQHGDTPVMGLLTVTSQSEGRRKTLALRPDAVCLESDGLTWFEVDRSARGSDRAASLRALVLSIGGRVRSGEVLRRVVVYTRTERIRKRIQSTLNGLCGQTEALALIAGRRQLKAVTDSLFEVWHTVVQPQDGYRTRLVDLLAGHVHVQELPVGLPRVRIDGRGDLEARGWFSENYLPYTRPFGATPWLSPRSPFLS